LYRGDSKDIGLEILNFKKMIKQIFIEIKIKLRSFIINGLLQYFGNTSCHYQAKISKEKNKY
jgi:hypothetical protein